MWNRGGNELPQSKPDGFASSLGEGASGVPPTSVLALSVTCGASSPKGRASGETGDFAIYPITFPPCQRPHPRGRLPPLRGKMSPKVTKRGIWLRPTGADWGSFGRYPLSHGLRRASSPKGTPLRYAGNFMPPLKAVPLDRLSPAGERCRVSDRVGSGWHRRRR